MSESVADISAALSGKDFDFPALMESARARLNSFSDLWGPCFKPDSEHAGLLPYCHHFVFTFATVGKPVQYVTVTLCLLPWQSPSFLCGFTILSVTR